MKIKKGKKTRLTKQLKKWKWVFFAVLLAMIFGFIACSWEVFALIFTAVIIMWYAAETRAIRLSSILPGLTMRWLRPNGGDWALILTNQGKGTALNIDIKTSNSIFKIDIKGVNAIYQGDTIYVELQKSGKKLTTEHLNDLGVDPLVVTIYFGSAENLAPSLLTKVEIKNPPYAKILKTEWN